MEGIKAIIQAEGIEDSVEFSVEELIARMNAGKPWGEMNDAEREKAMKDYALSLFIRQNGPADNVQITLGPGTFSTVQDGGV